MSLLIVVFFLVLSFVVSLIVVHVLKAQLLILVRHPVLLCYLPPNHPYLKLISASAPATWGRYFPNRSPPPPLLHPRNRPSTSRALSRGPSRRTRRLYPSRLGAGTAPPDLLLAPRPQDPRRSSASPTPPPPALRWGSCSQIGSPQAAP